MSIVVSKKIRPLLDMKLTHDKYLNASSMEIFCLGVTTHQLKFEAGNFKSLNVVNLRKTYLVLIKNSFFGNGLHLQHLVTIRTFLKFQRTFLKFHLLKRPETVPQKSKFGPQNK